MERDERVCLLCHRCGAELTPGEGNFYIVRILAVADPTPPAISEADLQTDISAEIDRILNQVQDMSEQELTEQIFRRLTIHLCTPCYRQWIENPAG
ncbi:MAG: hypothetical protein AMJ81_09140 [Phycisphaerae bacterium SM23_33]|nr:MAG: hypothetical protein AMJ81_09140 [Phycisphaerae bacterium SM23_33]